MTEYTKSINPLDLEAARERVACDAAATKLARGMVAYVRKCAEKHDELAHAPGVSVDGCMIHEANAHALRVVAAELAEFCT